MAQTVRSTNSVPIGKKQKKKHETTLAFDLKENWQLYVMVAPLVIWLALYAYKPLWGMVIAFQDYSPFLGIIKSPFTGFDNFIALFFGPGAEQFWRAFRNTILLSLYGIVFGFPAPIILALLFNEARDGLFRKVVQTVTYIPHFISEVVIAGMVLSFLALNTGIVNVLTQNILGFFGIQYEHIQFMALSKYFPPVYILSGIWKNVGFESIVFFAALMGIDPTLYEAAKIDGASKLKQIMYVSIPGIMPTIVVMLIIRIGNILNIGYEKVILLYNPLIYDTADVLSTFTYRLGIVNPPDYGLSTAASLINSIVGFALVIAANRFAKKVSSTSLW